MSFETHVNVYHVREDFGTEHWTFGMTHWLTSTLWENAMFALLPIEQVEASQALNPERSGDLRPLDWRMSAVSRVAGATGLGS